MSRYDFEILLQEVKCRRETPPSHEARTQSPTQGDVCWPTMPPPTLTSCHGLVACKETGETMEKRLGLHLINLSQLFLGSERECPSGH